MSENLVPMVVMTGMFAMIFGIAYLRNRENMAMVEKGLNPRQRDASPRPFLNLKWGLLMMGCGLGLLFAYIIDNTLLNHNKAGSGTHITLLGHRTGNKNKITAVIDSGGHGKDTSIVAKNDEVQTGDEGTLEAHSVAEIHGNSDENVVIYFALIAIGGGLGLFFSYRIEKKEWLDKKINQ